MDLLKANELIESEEDFISNLTDVPRVGYKVDDLKRMLKVLGLTQSGNKPELVSRIRKAVGLESGDPTPSSYKSVTKDEPISPVTRQLYEDQVPQMESILNAFAHDRLAVCDHSPTGTGKTHIGLSVAKALNLPILLICSGTLAAKWKSEATNYGVYLYEPISYQKMVGKSGKTNHPWLTRKDTEHTKIVRGVLQTFNKHKFTPTKQLIDLVKSGVLIFFDEYHHMKNITSLASNAGKVITRTIKNCYDEDKTCRSRCICASATPLDKEQLVGNMMKLLTLVQRKKIFDPRSTSIVDEVRMLAFKKNPRETNKIIEEFGIVNKSNANSLITALFSDILYEDYVFEMSPDKIFSDNRFAPVVKNLAIWMSEEDRLEHNIGVTDLMTILKYDRITGDIVTPKVNRETPINGALKIIELSKVKYFISLAKAGLLRGYKVILAVNFTETIDQLYDALEDNGVLVLNGEVPMKDRQPIIDLFKKDSDEYNVMVINGKVGSEGIDLDDVHGNRPRLLIISPGYGLIQIQQSLGRTARKTTKSKGVTFIVYGPEDSDEMKILQSLYKKTETLKLFVKKQADSENVIFAGDKNIFIGFKGQNEDRHIKLLDEVMKINQDILKENLAKSV